MSHRFKIAYGIDATDRHVVVVRAGGHGRFETLAGAGSPGVPEALRRRIAEEVASGRAASAAALACHESVMRRLHAPFARPDRALKVLPSLLDVQLPFALEHCCHVFTGLAPAAGPSTRALALAARREDVQHAIQRLGSAGLDPVFLDHEGLALWRMAGDGMPPGGADGAVVVHLGPAHLTVAYGRGDELFGAHSSRLSGTEAPVAELAARIQSWLRAQTSLAVTPQTAWIFAGSGAADAARVDGLRAQLGCAGGTVAADPATFLARALAARALRGDAFSCNLRTGDLEHPQSRRGGRARERRAEVAALAAAIALLGVNAAVLLALSRRTDGIQRRIQQVAVELSGAPAPKGQEVLVVRRALDEAAAAMRPFQQMVAAGTSRELGEVLSLCRTNGAAVSRLSLQPDALSLELTAANPGATDRISSALRFAGWQIQQQRRDPVVVIGGQR